MKIALCQLNAVMGDCSGNAKKIIVTVGQNASKADLFVFPELFINGYPPRDLLEQSWFIAQGLSALDELCIFSQQHPMCGIITGIALPAYMSGSKGLYNSAVLIIDGKILFHQNKSLLPFYDIFDESRYFDPAPEIAAIEFKGEKLGITICEDAWNPKEMNEYPRYTIDPVQELVDKGATILINIAASPFHLGKGGYRFSLYKHHAVKHRLPLVFVNLVGGNDELIFDGCSLYFDANGSLCEALPAFQEAFTVIDTDAIHPEKPEPALDTVQHVRSALVLGIRDYFIKCGFKKALVGLSGGIDSALTIALATEAVGAKNVLGITMPSRFSSEGSVNDSKRLAENLGIHFKVIPIDPLMDSFNRTLAPYFSEAKPDVTEENIQARIRGTLLMSFSNKFGYLLLSTGNKSELAVGYCTLYGDMTGGLAVVSDVYKTMVYELARHMNQAKEIIPPAIIAKAPSAELRPNQKDVDTLPPYDILDPILKFFIEECESSDFIVHQGFAKDTVQWVSNAIAQNEYKRRQAPLGLKITRKAFGSGRRFPIAARYKR